MPSEAVATTLDVTQILEKLGVSYAIGGSMASTTHGRVRATVDVDIVADLHQEHVQPLLAQLGDDFYADETAIRQAIRDKSSFNLIHLTTFFKVDIFVAKSRGFDHQQLARRQLQVLEPPDHVAYVTTPEDVLLAKLEWYRLGGEVSERQWSDIQGIMDIQGEHLDRPYIEQWAATLGVDELLHRAITEYEARQSPNE